MLTVRKLAKCLGSDADPIVLRGLFGGSPSPLSLLSLAAAATQKKLDLNVIRVGSEMLLASEDEIFSAVSFLSPYYAPVDVGIGSVHNFWIPLAEAEGHEFVDSDDEATAIDERWGFLGKAIDVFFVLAWSGATVGRSPVNGACSGGDKSRSGLVVAVEGSTTITANTLAHEIGHYLGLSHDSDEQNLMFKKVPNGGQLTKEQGQKLRRHCRIYTGCRQPK